MGGNVYCAVSHLPLHYGAKMRLFVVGQIDDGAPRPGGDWHAFSFGFAGEHGDFGSLDDIERTPAFELMHKALCAHVGEFSDDDKDRHDHLLETYPHEFGSILKLVERGVVNVTLIRAWGEHKMVPFYVREEVYQWVMEVARKSDTTWRQENIAEKAEREAKMLVEYYRKSQEPTEGLTVEELTARWRLSERPELEMLRGTYLGNVARMLMLEKEDAPNYEDLPTWDGLGHELAELRIFELGLELFGHSWVPQIHFVPDDVDYRLHTKFHKAMAKFGEELRKEYS